MFREASTKENGTTIKAKSNKHMCPSNCDDLSSGIGASLDVQIGGMHRNTDVDVDIMNCINHGEVTVAETECHDVTENSSSFGGTISEDENDASFNDAEVTSELHGEATSTLTFDGYAEILQMGKKKLTSHWRNFMHPLMWRCRWVELQIRKLQSQATVYDRKLAEYHSGELFGSRNITSEELGARSAPFLGQSQRVKVMKRKKRRRVETTTDIESYMSRHNLFSYYDSKCYNADAAQMDDYRGNSDMRVHRNDEFGINEELFSLDFREDESSLEHILQKIRVVQSQVREMKARLQKVMTENAGLVSPTDGLGLLLPCNALNRAAQNHASPPRMHVGSSYVASQVISDYNMVDLVLPESTVPSNEEMAHNPDKIKSTNQPQNEGILIYNRRAKEELMNFQEINVLPAKKDQSPTEEQRNPSPPVPVLIPELPLPEQQPPKIRSISKIFAPRNKRKRGRGRRKAQKSNRRSSG